MKSLTEGALNIDVGETTSLTGATIASESGELVLDTGDLVVENLIERARSSQIGFNVSVGEGGFGSSQDSGGSDFGVTGGGGSFSNSALDGTTRATIGEGVFVVILLYL